MRVLCDVVSPGQVHFFKNLLLLLQAEGHDVLVTARDKDIVLALLRKLDLEHVCLSRQGSGSLGMARELIVRDFALWKEARRFRPDVMIAQTGVSTGLVGALLGVPRVVLEEAEHATFQRLVGLPFANYIMTGTGYLGSHGRRERKFKGIWVQSYLDPRHFSFGRDALLSAGFDPEPPYIVMRTIAWDAAHDAGRYKPGIEVVSECIDRLSEHRRVYLSHEGELSRALLPHKLPVPIDLAHHLIANAELYVGEGGTMAAEAAVLGVPSVYCNPLRCGYLLALENQYGLLRCVNTLGEGLEIALGLLADPAQRQGWKTRSETLWSESDDITQFAFQVIREAVGMK
jgi:predicted glycosyltransferase